MSKTSIVLIIQARVGSTRLPSKVMLDLGGVTQIERILERVKKVKKINKIIVATTKKKSDDILANIVREKKIEVFRGSEKDLVDRFYQTVKGKNFTHILRLPADNPIPDALEYDKLINYHLKSDNDFSSNIDNFMNNGYPSGIGVEIFSYNALQRIWRFEKRKKYREHIHLNFYDYKNEQKNKKFNFKIGTIKCPKEISRPELAFHVDYHNEHVFFKKLYQHFQYAKLKFTTKDVIDWYDKVYSRKSRIMNLKKFDLKDKNALITGAGGLLGFEHAYALLEVGAYLILTDNNIKSLIKNKIRLKKYFNEENFCAIKMDVTKEKSVLSCFRQLKKNGKKVDILINNAAIDPKDKKISNFKKTRMEYMSLKNWNKEIEVGLTGAFLCTKIFCNEMFKNRKGIILNILSDLSIIAPNQLLYADTKLNQNRQPVKPVTYSIIKFGLLGLTKYLATYCVGSGIRCNALSPGAVLDQRTQNKKFKKKLSKLIPMGRMAQPNEYRSAVQFLCSDASSYMNGHNLVMDGGRIIW